MTKKKIKALAVVDREMDELNFHGGSPMIYLTKGEAQFNRLIGSKVVPVEISYIHKIVSKPKK